MSAYTTGELQTLWRFRAKPVHFTTRKPAQAHVAQRGRARLYYSHGLDAPAPDLRAQSRFVCRWIPLWYPFDEKPEAVLKLLLDEQDQQIGRDILTMEKPRDTIRSVRKRYQTACALHEIHCGL
jgi:hypothetical protein